MKRKLSICVQLGLPIALSVLVLCILSSHGTAQQPPPFFSARNGNRRVVLPIERSSRFGAILVTLRVNGKPAVLILDTGSNTTILSPEISGLRLARLPRAAPPRKGTGFVGDGRWGQATLTIGSTVWKDQRVLVVDTKDLSQALQQKIDGILGQDILDEFKYMEINLVEKRLTLGFD
jgi:hypothetical protein